MDHKSCRRRSMSPTARRIPLNTRLRRRQRRRCWRIFNEARISFRPSRNQAGWSRVLAGVRITRAITMRASGRKVAEQSDRESERGRGRTPDIERRDFHGTLQLEGHKSVNITAAKKLETLPADVTESVPSTGRRRRAISRR